MINFALVPHSKATNSYDLLLDVIKAIDDEPLRFYWGDWVRDAADIYADASVRPTCGTVACLHGWINLLTAPELNDAFGLNTDKWFPEITLGEFENLAYAEGRYGIIDDEPITDDDEDNDRINRQKNETQRQYADRGIAAIRLFMTRFENDLKFHDIEIPQRIA